MPLFFPSKAQIKSAKAGNAQSQQQIAVGKATNHIALVGHKIVTGQSVLSGVGLPVLPSGLLQQARSAGQAYLNSLVPNAAQVFTSAATPTPAQPSPSAIQAPAPPGQLFDPGNPPAAGSAELANANIPGPDVNQLTGGALASIATDGLPKTGNLAVAPMFSSAGQGMRFTDEGADIEDGTESPVSSTSTPSWLVPAAMIVGLVLLWRQS